MRELYDRLITEGEAGIDRLIAEQTPESVQLDFKRKDNPRNGEFETNDKRVLAQALSGFANSAGGLLVLGIDARKGPDQVDCAQATHPIADIRRLLSEATTLVGQSVQPRLDGVELAAVPSTRQPGAGYLLVLVQRSDRRPHRSEAKGQKQYYKRAGDSFFEMEHYDIEDAFSRTRIAKLEIIYKIHPYMSTDSERHDRIKVWVRNKSDQVAKYPFLSVDMRYGIRASQYGVDDNGRQGLKLIQADQTLNFVGGSDDVLHPGMELPIAGLAVSLRKADDGSWRTVGSLAQGKPPAFDFIVGCEGGASEHGTVQFKFADFGIRD